MKTYEIVISTTHTYSARKEFSSEEEADAWAKTQGQEVTLEDSPDWSFDDGVFEVEAVSERSAPC